ncbi:MAG: hypothetical protein NTV86_14620 [Planctomycetota bacterium]|nr:hypothetical protein [Planctomycetota bacterium]
MCPLIDKPDNRCRLCLCVGQIELAFRYCADRHEDCPVYRERCVEELCRQNLPERAVLAAAG